MNLRLKKYLIGMNESHKIIEEKYCCDSIKICDYIELGTDDSRCEQPAICITQKEPWCDGDTSFTELKYHSIKFCPFCGEEIYISVDEVEDVTTVYNEIEGYATAHRENARKEDSISKRDEQVEYARGLERKLDYFLSTDSIHY